MLAVKRQKHHLPMLERFAPDTRFPEGDDPVQRMTHRLGTKAGRVSCAGSITRSSQPLASRPKKTASPRSLASSTCDSCGRLLSRGIMSRANSSGRAIWIAPPRPQSRAVTSMRSIWSVNPLMWPSTWSAARPISTLASSTWAGRSTISQAAAAKIRKEKTMMPTIRCNRYRRIVGSRSEVFAVSVMGVLDAECILHHLASEATAAGSHRDCGAKLTAP